MAGLIITSAEKEQWIELQAPETIKLFGSTKKLKDKIKNGNNVLSLEVVEVILVQWNLVDNEHQQKHTFTANSGAYLSNVPASNLLFVEAYNIKFDGIIKTITDQIGRLLEI